MLDKHHNSVDPDQMPHFAASDLGIHCLLRPVCPNLRVITVISKKENRWNSTNLKVMSPLITKILLIRKLTLVLLNPDMSCLCKQFISRSGSALFVIKFMNLYQQPGSSNVIGWLFGSGCGILNYSVLQGLNLNLIKSDKSSNLVAYICCLKQYSCHSMPHYI